jgi:hypothetical protein
MALEAPIHMPRQSRAQHIFRVPFILPAVTSPEEYLMKKHRETDKRKEDIYIYICVCD